MTRFTLTLNESVDVVLNSIKLMRGCLIFNNNQLKKYINLVFDAYWKNNENITDDKVLTKILDNIEVNLDEFKKKIEETEIKEKLKFLTNDAFKKNIFGAPTYVVNTKNFWGQDRYENAIEELNSTS